jgi:hypothetical protein
MASGTTKADTVALTYPTGKQQHDKQTKLTQPARLLGGYVLTKGENHSRRMGTGPVCQTQQVRSHLA